MTYYAVFNVSADICYGPPSIDPHLALIFAPLFGVELPHPLQMSLQLRKRHLLIQHFM